MLHLTDTIKLRYLRLLLRTFMVLRANCNSPDTDAVRLCAVLADYLHEAPKLLTHPDKFDERLFWRDISSFPKMLPARFKSQWHHVLRGQKRSWIASIRSLIGCENRMSDPDIRSDSGQPVFDVVARRDHHFVERTLTTYLAICYDILVTIRNLLMTLSPQPSLFCERLSDAGYEIMMFLTGSGERTEEQMWEAIALLRRDLPDELAVEWDAIIQRVDATAS
jgi:hypothetical protein